MRFITFIILSLVCHLSFASEIPENNAYPGGIAVIKTFIKSEKKPTVFFLKKKVALIKYDSNQWIALVGIPLDYKDDTGTVMIKGKTNQDIIFPVGKKKYRVEKLTIKNDRMVNPHPSDLKRIYAESKMIRQAFSTWTDTDITNKVSLPLPATGRISSPFGLRRFMNGVEKSPHSGLDIAAPTGTTIFSPQDGTVILTGTFYYTGNIVLIDHGQGMITGYCHLNETYVEQGTKLKKGQQLGTIGNTGRVTGAHLHWILSLNGQKVDPKLLLNKKARIAFTKVD